MVNMGWTRGPCRGGLDSRVKQQEASFLHSFSSLWNRPSSHGLSASCPSFQVIPSTLSHGTILDSSLFLLVLFTSLISREGPILFCSIICTRAHAFSQLLVGKICAVSSVLEPEIHSKCWPHFTDEETEKLRQHHWSEGGQLLNRRAGI